MTNGMHRWSRLGWVLWIAAIGAWQMDCNDGPAQENAMDVSSSEALHEGSHAEDVAAHEDTSHAAADDHAHAESESHEHERDEREHDEHESGTLRLSKEQLQAAGIELAPARADSIDSGIELLGEVRPNGERVAHIVPRFPGVVQSTRKSVGDSVRRGDVLAIIESSDSLVPYEIKTLIDGVVLEKHLTLGEAVGSDAAAFIVADLSTIWVDLRVYPQDLGSTRVGQEVLISAGGDGPTARGTISYVTPSVDPRTRTATARVELPNPDLAWRPGLFVSARVLDPVPVAVAIPMSAVQRIEGEPHVFVEADGELSARPVVLGREGDTLVQIVSGIPAGATIVVRNAFLLKAELGKGEAEHHH